MDNSKQIIFAARQDGRRALRRCLFIYCKPEFERRAVERFAVAVPSVLRRANYFVTIRSDSNGESHRKSNMRQRERERILQRILRSQFWAQCFHEENAILRKPLNTCATAEDNRFRRHLYVSHLRFGRQEQLRVIHFAVMRVAIVHYWLLGMRGGEKVVEVLCRMFPDADLFTLFYDPERVSPLIRSKTVRTSFLNPARRHYRSLLPLMPLALESFDLRGYDLVISSESGPAKGVLVSSSSRHLCYCHSPMRYLWELYPAYLHDYTKARWKRALMAPIANYLRLWDYASAARVDEFVANSRNVQQRVWRAYHRDSVVVFPPVPVDTFFHKPSEAYLLIVSELVAYKQLDYAVRYCARNNVRLKVVGDGPEFGALRTLSGSTVEFCGRVTEAELRDLYARCRALIVPGEEDFGMATVEALASGKPVVGFNRGGTRDIVAADCGVLYENASESCLHDALKKLDAGSFRPENLQSTASKFSEAEFVRRMSLVVQSSGLLPTTSRVNTLNPEYNV
jgi:glycosyltransferase involved in cell wall biosynthesis